MENQRFYSSTRGSFSRFKQLAPAVRFSSVNTKVCQSFCIPVLPTSLIDLWIQILFHYRPQWHMVIQIEKTIRRHFTTFRVDPCTEKFRASLTHHLQLSECSCFLLQKPVHIQSFPRSAKFPFVGRFIQSRLVFAAFGTACDELFDIVIHKKQPSLAFN